MITGYFNNNVTYQEHGVKTDLKIKNFNSVSKFINILLLIIFLYSPYLLNAASKPMNGNHVDFNLLLQNLKNNNANSYTWLIESSNDWDDLYTFMPLAKMNGIKVWVSLIPPSKTPPIDPNGSYSHPYKNDYVTWANEIAQLSLTILKS